jgi:hypothetical protein
MDSRDGLLGLRPRPFGVALKGDRRRCAAASNRLVYVGGSNSEPTSRGTRSGSIAIFQKYGSPGRIRTADQRINSPSLYH